jgi:hypothetical protein
MTKANKPTSRYSGSAATSQRETKLRPRLLHLKKEVNPHHFSSSYAASSESKHWALKISSRPLRELRLSAKKTLCVF